MFNEQNDDASAKSHNEILRATNPLELSLEICAFASIVKNFEASLAEGVGFTEQIAAYNTSFQLFQETCKFPKPGSRVKDKIFGVTTERAKQNVFPWLCSLKEAGFQGNHRCGVTLLSGKH